MMIRLGIASVALLTLSLSAGEVRQVSTPRHAQSATGRSQVPGAPTLHRLIPGFDDLSSDTRACLSSMDPASPERCELSTHQLHEVLSDLYFIWRANQELLDLSDVRSGNRSFEDDLEQIKEKSQRAFLAKGLGDLANDLQRRLGEAVRANAEEFRKQPFWEGLRSQSDARLLEAYLALEGDEPRREAILMEQLRRRQTSAVRSAGLLTQEESLERPLHDLSEREVVDLVFHGKPANQKIGALLGAFERAESQVAREHGIVGSSINVEKRIPRLVETLGSLFDKRQKELAASLSSKLGEISYSKKGYKLPDSIKVSGAAMVKDVLNEIDPGLGDALAKADRSQAVSWLGSSVLLPPDADGNIQVVSTLKYDVEIKMELEKAKRAIFEYDKLIAKTGPTEAWKHGLSGYGAGDGPTKLESEKQKLDDALNAVFIRLTQLGSPVGLRTNLTTARSALAHSDNAAYQRATGAFYKEVAWILAAPVAVYLAPASALTGAAVMGGGSVLVQGARLLHGKKLDAAESAHEVLDQAVTGVVLGPVFHKVFSLHKGLAAAGTAYFIGNGLDHARHLAEEGNRWEAGATLFNTLALPVALSKVSSRTLARAEFNKLAQEVAGQSLSGKQLRVLRQAHEMFIKELNKSDIADRAAQRIVKRLMKEGVDGRAPPLFPEAPAASGQPEIREDWKLFFRLKEWASKLGDDLGLGIGIYTFKSKSGNYYTGIYHGTDSNGYIQLSPKDGSLKVLRPEKLDLNSIRRGSSDPRLHDFKPDDLVRLISVRGNEHRGYIKGFSNNGRTVEFLPEGAEKSIELWVDRLQLGETRIIVKE